MDEATLGASTCNHDRKHPGPVISAGITVDFRSSSKFGSKKNHRGIQKASFIKIADQGCNGFIHRRQVALDGALDVVVMVPPACCH